MHLTLNKVTDCFIMKHNLNVLSKTTYVFLEEVYGREAMVARRRSNTLRHSNYWVES